MTRTAIHGFVLWLLAAAPATAFQGQVDAISREFTIWVRDPEPQQVDAISREFTLWTRDPEPQQADAISREFTLRLPMPDLVVSSVSTPGAQDVSTTYQVTWRDTNVGDGPAAPSWTDRVYATMNTVVGDADDVLLGSFTFSGSIPVGQFIDRTQTVTLPATAGTWRLAVVTDATDVLAELEGANNSALSGVFTLLPTNPPRPDLTSSIQQAPAGSVLSGSTISVTYRVTNGGTAATNVASWTDRLYLTTSGAGDPSSGIVLGSFPNVSFLAAGAFYERSVTVNLPADFSGTRFVAVRTDAGGAMSESNEANNDGFSASFQVDLEPQPDLVVQFDPHAPTIVFSGTYLDGTDLDWRDVNQGVGVTEVGSWSDRVWLSLDSNPSISAGDIDLGTSAYSGGILGPGGQALRTGSFFLPVDLQGTFFVKVKVDSGNAVSEFGFENNNIGVRPDSIQVVLAVTPDLSPTAVQRLGAGPALAGHATSFQWSVADLHPGATTWETGINWVDRIYLSSDTVWDGSDVQLWSASQSAYVSGSAWVGTNYTKSASAVLPQGAAAGTWYLIARVDADGGVFEHDAGYDAEANNRAVSPPFQVEVQPTDLVIAASAAENPTSAAAGQALTLKFRVSNTGTAGTNVASWVDRVYLSTDAVLSGDPIVATASRSTVLGPSPAFYDVTVSGSVPLVAGGSYFLLFACDAGNQVWELGGEGNNVVALPFTVLPQTANLVASAVNAPDSAVVGAPFAVGWRVTNAGTLATPVSQWSDRVYVSLDTVLDGTDLQIGSVTRGSTLAAGAFYDGSGSFTVNGPIADGLYYVLVKTDAASQVYEGDESDNVAWDRMRLSVTNTPPPNLVLDSVSAPAGPITSGQSVQVSWTGRNAGIGATGSSQWSDSVYLSLDQNLDVGTDIYLGFATHAGHLAPGETYAASQAFTVPLGTSGNWFALVRANSNGALAESTTVDNTRSSPTLTNLVLPPSVDLAVTSITVPASLVPGQGVTIDWTLTNEQAGSSVTGSWTDTLYLSSDGLLDGGDVVLGQVTTTVTALAGGGTLPRSATLTAPAVLPGLYRVLIWTDTLGQVPETDEGDNIVASTGFVDATLPALAPGGSLALQLGDGAQRYARLDAPVGQSVRVNLDHDSAGAWTELYVGVGRMPAPGVADFTFGAPGHASQEILIPVVAAAPHYVLARTTFGAGGTPTGTLAAALVPFDVTAVVPGVAGSGVVTFELAGSQLDTLTGVQLRARGGAQTYTAAQVHTIDAARALARFDLSSATAGLYDLLASGNGAVTVPSAVTIEPAGPLAAGLSVELAPSVKKGSTGLGALSIRNAGNVNLPWAVLVLGTPVDPGAVLSAPSAGLSTLEPGTIAATGLFLIDDLGPSQASGLGLVVAPSASYAASDLVVVLAGRAIDDAERDTLVLATSEALRARVAADPTSDAGILALAGSPASWQAAVSAGLAPDPSELHLPGTAPRTGRDLVLAIAAAAESGVSGGPSPVPQSSIDAALGDLACLWLGAAIDCATLARQGCTDGLAQGEITQVAGGNLPVEEVCVSTPTSDDPNEKTPPTGFGQQGLVASGNGMVYRVYFENVATAAAPAARVVIEDDLEAGLVASTFRALRIKFGDTLLELPQNTPSYSNIYDFSATLGIRLQLVAGVDGATNRAFWIFNSLDPATNLPVTDGARGFLPPNDASGRGSGYVEFVVVSNPTTATGTTVRNRAGVRFDVNPTLPTNEVQNVVDGDDPASDIAASPIAGDEYAYQLSWSGQDPAGGAGLESFSAYVSTDGGPFVPFVTDTQGTTQLFHAEPGRTYRFYTRARDHVGRREPVPVLPDVEIVTPPDCNENGVGDPTDISSGASLDCDGNAVPDECEADGDGDGTIDACDGCPTDPLKTAPGVCGCNVSDTDGDGDGTADCQDGCPTDPLKTAPGQCGCGNPDTDTDLDGVADCVDNCPALPNPGQKDCDGDGLGDVCEFAAGAKDCNQNGLPDNCDIASGTSKDVNGNGVPDECESVKPVAFCLPGQAGVAACPCGNPPGISGRGCQNSAGTGGGLLSSQGEASLGADTLSIRASGVLPSALCIFIQGTAASNGSPFGDGVRCVAGAVKRFGLRGAVGGAVRYPGLGDVPVSVRSAQLGDPIVAGTTRWYQVYYRDPNPTFGCPAPANFNLTGGLKVLWSL